MGMMGWAPSACSWCLYRTCYHALTDLKWCLSQYILSNTSFLNPSVLFCNTWHHTVVKSVSGQSDSILLLLVTGKHFVVLFLFSWNLKSFFVATEFDFEVVACFSSSVALCVPVNVLEGEVPVFLCFLSNVILKCDSLPGYCQVPVLCQALCQASDQYAVVPLSLRDLGRGGDQNNSVNGGCCSPQLINLHILSSTCSEHNIASYSARTWATARLFHLVDIHRWLNDDLQ